MMHRARLLGLFALMLVCLAASSLQAADPEPKGENVEQDFAAELPKIPPKSPEESLAAFQVKPGFRVELVASEPLIRSPMAMDFDEYGRAFVVELPEYNQYASAEPHGRGAVKLLEDTDQDGRYDRASIYVSDLDYPTAVACYDGGILVGVAPDLLYCKDTDGDGQADIRQKLFTGFGQDKAGEGMLNSIRWRIDNRFHIPTGLDGGEIVPAAERVAADQTVRPINARGQHLLLEPRSITLEGTSGGGQHGMSLDDWNLHAFVCGNSEPVHLIMYDGRYLARNAYLEAPAAAVNIAPEGKFTKLMRISEVEPWRALRTRLRSQGVIPGSDEGGQPSGFFTGATGITVYRGDAWPAEYRGDVFVGEVANNLVYRARLEPSGVGLTARRADADAEFLASTDNWFRPVQFASAPDGTLYVIDMYRELIEGAAFLAPQILKHMDPGAGSDKGRIYRIAPEDFQFSAPPRLGDMSSVELVAFYEHPNAWHRETAARLIYERQDAAAVDPLRIMAAESSQPLARIMALYSLQGLGALRPPQVVRALASPSAESRQHALRLAESFAMSADVRQAVLRLTGDDDLRVRYQAAFSLGAFAGPEVTRALSQLALRDGADPWMQLAVLSSSGTRRGELFAQLADNEQARSAEHVRSIMTRLAAQIGAANQREDLALVFQRLDRLSRVPGAEGLTDQLVRSLVRAQPAAGQLAAESNNNTIQQIIASLLSDARAAALDGEQSVEARTAAVRTLASARLDDVEGDLAELLSSQQPQPVQAAALETLAYFDEPQVADLILEAWPSQTPQVRATAVETLFSRPAWIHAFLEAVAQEDVARGDLDPARIALLKEHGEEAIRERASQLFAGTSLARRQEVVDQYQAALERKGDVERGRQHFRQACAACHQLEGVGESIGADLKAIRDRGTAAVLLNILDPNREVKPQYLSYVVALDSGRTITGLIAAETANSLTIRKPDGMSETVLRVNIEELRSTGLSYMPEGLEKQIDVAAMADLLAYLNSSF